MVDLPPSRRDVTTAPRKDGAIDLSPAVRHHDSYLESLDPGILRGRFATPRPTGKGTPLLVGGDASGAGDDTPLWEDGDRLTVTTAGQQVWTLSHEPLDESLFVRWHPRGLTYAGIPWPNEFWTLDESTVVIPDPHSLIEGGDAFSAQYQYLPDEGSDNLFEERMADSPAAYYRFGETSGTTIFDSSGNSRDGSPGYLAGYTLGAPSLDSSDPGNASVQVDIATGNLQVPYNNWMNFTTGYFSVVALIKPDAIGVNQVIVARDNNGTHGPWRLDLNSAGKVVFMVWSAVFTNHVVTGTTAIAAGSRHDVAGRYNPVTGEISVLVDGQIDGTAVAPAGLPLGDPAQRLSFGCYNATNGPFGGLIDEVAIYNSVVSEARFLAQARAAGVA